LGSYSLICWGTLSIFLSKELNKPINQMKETLGTKMQGKGSRFSKKERKKESSSQQKATINRSSMGGKSAKKPKSGDGERGERRMQRTGGDRRRHRCAGKQTLTTTKIAQNGTEKES
jgi:hypothetical protein